MKLTLLVAVAIVAPSCYDAYLPAPKPNGCTKDGRFFPYGKFEDHSDHCNECECFQDGNYKCSKRACPAANCPVEKMKYRPGSCCAECFDHRSKTSDSNSDSDHHTSYDKNTRNRRTLENTPDEESSGSTTSESYNAAVGRRRFARTIVYKPGSRTSDQHGSSSSSDGKGHTGGKGSGRSGSKSSHSSKSGKGGKSSRSSGGHTSKSSGDNRPEGYNRARRSLNIDDKADVRRFVRTIVYKPGSRTSDNHGSSSSSDGHNGGKGSGRSGSKSSHSSKSGKGGKSSESSEGHTSKSSSDYRPEGYNRARRSVNIDDEADVRRFVRTIVYNPGSRTSDHHGSSSSSDGKGLKGSGRSGSKSSHSSKSGKGGKSSGSSEGHTSKSSGDNRPEGYNRVRRSLNIDDEADVRRFIRTIVYNPGSRTSDHHGSSSSSDGHKGGKGSGRSGSKSSHSKSSKSSKSGKGKKSGKSSKSSGKKSHSSHSSKY